MFLVGDIGGTRSRFYAIEGEKIVFEHIYSSKSYTSFPFMVEDFLKKSRLSFSVFVFGIAGVVVDGFCKTTNLPWEVSLEEIKKAAKCSRGYLVNDLNLLSYGVCQLSQSQFEVLQNGEIKKGPRLVVCPGTGLGVCCVINTTPYLQLLPTEAGHVDFAPENKGEFDLLCYFHKIYEHVSIERFVSGSGIPNIYKFLCHSRGVCENLTTSEEITEAALKKTDEIACQTIDLFLELFASTLGNFSLIYLPFEGVYICGSLMRKLYPLMDQKKFFHRFASKGRFCSLLQKIPVFLVKEDKLAPLSGRAFIKSYEGIKDAN